MRTVSTHGAEIPVLGLGTWQLKGEQASGIVARALNLGYTHIDTARMYDNETAVGQGLRDSGVARDRIFLTTKIWPEDFARDDFLAAADDSLRNLGVDHVDLLLLHWPSPTVPLEETLDALSTVVEQGKARHAGVSNFTISLCQQAVAAARVPIVCNQVEYHPFIAQEKLRRFLESGNQALVGYCPLAKGRVHDDPVLKRIAESHGATPAQIALAWELSHPNVCCIPKTANPDRLAENLKAAEIALTAAEVAEIDTLASPGGRMVSVEGFAPDWD